VLYFVSTTVNPILYNVLSRKYRQAFVMTLCNACMDPATRQRLQRDGFAGAYTVYYSTTAAGRVSANRMSVVDATYAAVTAASTPTRRRAVGRPPVESASPRAFTSVTVAARFHNGRVTTAAGDPEARRLRLPHASDVDEQSRRQLLDERVLASPYRPTSAATRHRDDDGSTLTEDEEESSIRFTQSNPQCSGV